MSETIKLCAMLARAVFENDDEAREPFVEQAMRAKREHDEMRRELAEARRAVDNIGDAYDRLVSAVVGGVASAAYCFDTSEYEKQAERLRADIEQADTTRREWEVRAATSYRDGRAAGLREAGIIGRIEHAETKQSYFVHRVGTYVTLLSGSANSCAPTVHRVRDLLGMEGDCWWRDAILALAPPAAETVVPGLDCPHCGDIAFESTSGLFRDGDGERCMSCGFPGHVSCDTETLAYWQPSDADDARCRDVSCCGASEPRDEGES